MDLHSRRRTIRSSAPIRYFLCFCLVLGICVAWRLPLSPTTTDDDVAPAKHHKVARSHNNPLQSPLQDSKSTLQTNERSPFDYAMDANTSPKPHEAPLRVVTYNVRYATANPDKGEETWAVRAPKLITQLEFIAAGQDNTFLCLQECLHKQVEDIDGRLGSSWAYVGRGRDAKETGGEYSPIFYRTDTWKLVQWDTRWLSKTPKEPSRGWDAVLNRIATIGVFQHKHSGTKLVVISTHFDHIGVKAREHSAQLLIEFARQWRQEHDPVAVVVAGDFNSQPGDHAYQTMVADGSGMADVLSVVGKDKRYGNDLTYTGFGGGEPPERIDFLFVERPSALKAKTFGVLTNVFDDGVKISDHRPVVADFSMPLQKK